MKFSKETLNILSNLSRINTNIFFNKGDMVKTISPESNVYVEAKIKDSIPVSFGIFQLPKFISSINMFEDAELDFSNQGWAVISGNGCTLRYVYDAEEALVLPPPESEIAKMKAKSGVDKPEIDINISEDNLEDVKRAAGIIDVQDISIVGDGNKMFLSAKSVDNPTNNEFSIEIGETDKNFSIDFKIDTLKMLPGNYNLKIGKGGFSKWTNQAIDVVYYIGPSTTSRFS